MQYKNILVYLDQGESNKERVKTALAMSKFHGAQLTGVAVNTLPTASIMLKLGLGAGDKLFKKARKEAKETLKNFSKKMSEKNIKTDTCLIECKESLAPERLARFARNYDISIMRQPNPDKPHSDLIADLSEEVLFSSGRPVFFMPYIGAHAIPSRKAIIAWDGSASATRAVHDALPLLESIEETVILVVDAEKIVRNTDSEPGEGLSLHLTAHGIKNQVSRVPSGGVSTSTIVLNEVADKGVDLLVMGGYGTSKLREIILGGVTRSLFQCMTVPVVMSH
jgi:nucleotide-binding universal stress UspA family protein